MRAFAGTDKSWHSNRKELWTVVHAVSQFGKYWRSAGEPTRVLILCDNKTAVACVNKRTSSKSHMQVLCDRLATLQLQYNCEVRAAWIPGRLNTLADRLSRESCAPHSADYQLLRSEFDKWDKLFGPHEVDAFADAAGENAFCQEFWSAKQNALKQQCGGRNVWCNPDFDLAGKRCSAIWNARKTVSVARQPPLSYQ